MAGHNDFGKAGEERAVAYLEQSGYIILEQNWRLGRKEIDVICTDGEIVIVVEVKSRHAAEEYPEEILDHKKKRNLLQAGAAYIRQKGMEKELRFDLIIVIGDEYRIEHIQEAVQVIDL